MRRHIDTIPEADMMALIRWHWPGNVRELSNFIERAVILTQGNTLQAPIGELQHPNPASQAPFPSATLEAVEREHILQVLRECHGVVSGPNGAAARLGLNRSTLNSRMNKLGIKREDIWRDAIKVSGFHH
jgi:DNA-binding NtrC family response regulator